MPDNYLPSTKTVTLYIALVRKEARRVLSMLDSQRQDARLCRRHAAKLKERSNPFDTACIAPCERAAAAHDESCRLLQGDLLICGQFMTDISPAFDSATTLAQRCDILNVGVAGRAGLTQTNGLRRLVFSRALEYFAAHRCGEPKRGALHEAFFAVFEAALATKEGKKLSASLFEPGGVFQDVPTYRLSADGTFTRLPPCLRIVPGATTREAQA